MMAIAWRQFRLERRMFWRNPTAAFFGFLQASVDGVVYTPGMVPDGKLLFDEREFLDLWDVNDPSAP